LGNVIYGQTSTDDIYIYGYIYIRGSGRAITTSCSHSIVMGDAANLSSWVLYESRRRFQQQALEEPPISYEAAEG
jgi:hypothetical protein